MGKRGREGETEGEVVEESPCPRKAAPLSLYRDDHLQSSLPGVRGWYLANQQQSKESPGSEDGSLGKMSVVEHENNLVVLEWRAGAC